MKNDFTFFIVLRVWPEKKCERDFFFIRCNIIINYFLQTNK